MTKTFCDWCGSEAETSTGLYRVKLSKRGNSVNGHPGVEVTDINDEDVCGYCAHTMRQLREGAKSEVKAL